MNRVLCYLHRCPCQRTTAAKAERDRINQLVEDVAEAFHDEESGRLGFFLTPEILPTRDIPGAAAYLASELREIAGQCLGAAERLEGGAA